MDTANENREMLRHIYEEVSAGNSGPLLDALAEDVRWTIIGTTALSGVFEGKANVIEGLFKPLRARLSGRPVAFAPERFIAEGDHVVMQAHGSAITRAGKPYNNVYCIVAKFRDGKIVEMIDYVDTEMVTSALGA